MAVILIADDEAAIRRLLTGALERSGHSVLAASNGLEAVSVFRSYSNQIDLVVIDMMMPVMDGAQAIVRIRETRLHIPVICISGYVGGDIPVDCAFLQKPFSPAALVELVAQLLNAPPAR